MSRGTRLKMARPRMGEMSRRLCEVLSCLATATHWFDNGQGDGGEYCKDHAEHLYELAMAKYQEVAAPVPGAMSQ